MAGLCHPRSGHDRLEFGFDSRLRLTGIDPERAYKAKEIKELRDTADRWEDAPPIIKKIHKKGVEPDPLRGLCQTNINWVENVILGCP